MRVIGYKWLCVEAFPDDTRGITLRSAFDAHLWTRGTNVANYPPSEENMWGFNAYYSAMRARWSGRTYGTVIVGVVGFGTVAMYQHGWRSEKAEIVAVHLPRRFVRRVRMGKGSLTLELTRFRGHLNTWHLRVPQGGPHAEIKEAVPAGVPG